MESGLNFSIAAVAVAVSSPRSFCHTRPSWLTMKVMIPLAPYSAGYAISAKPFVSFPLTT